MAIVLLDSPTDVGSLGATFGWRTIDVSAHISASATGVMLNVLIGSNSSSSIGLRKNGSTDTDLEDVHGRAGAYVGVDGAGIFECYHGNAANSIDIVGYFEDEAFFFTNKVDYSPIGTAWEDFDITSDVVAGTAIAAIWDIGGSYNVGYRKNGSTDNRQFANFKHTWAIVGLDSGQICETISSNTAARWGLVGYILDTANATFNTNAPDKSTATTGSYVDLPALTTGAIGGIIETVSSGLGNRAYNLRKNGRVEDDYWEANSRSQDVVACDASYLVEARIEGVGIDMFEIGYITAGVVLPTAVVTGAYTGATALEKGIASSIDLSNSTSDLGPFADNVTASEITWADASVGTAGVTTAGAVVNHPFPTGHKPVFEATGSVTVTDANGESASVNFAYTVEDTPASVAGNDSGVVGDTRDNDTGTGVQGTSMTITMSAFNTTDTPDMDYVITMATAPASGPAVMSSGAVNQSARQDVFRSQGSISGTFNEDLIAAAIATTSAAGTLNELLIGYLQNKLSSSSTNLNDLMAEAAADRNKGQWGDLDEDIQDLGT